MNKKNDQVIQWMRLRCVCILREDYHYTVSDLHLRDGDTLFISGRSYGDFLSIKQRTSNV